jgi:hypothetical protein
MTTIALFDAFLKETYTEEKVENLTKSERPAWAMMPTDADCSGDVFVEPIIIGNPQGHGATRAKAQAGATQTGEGASLVGRKWQLTFGDYKDSVEVDEKLIRASRDDPGAFFRAQEALVDGLYEAHGDIMSTYLFSNGGQACGTGTISTGVITLADKESIANFAIGQILQASANDGSDAAHTLLGSGSEGFVISMDHVAGTVTVSTTSGGAAGTPASWSGTMFFFRSGDFGGSGATPIFKGFGAWILAAAAGGGDSHYGVNRSVSGLLQGVRLSATEVAGLPIDARLKRLVTRMTGRFGGPGPSDIFLNPEKWQDLADVAEARGQRPLDGKIGTLNFSKLQIAMGGKMVNIWADRFCPLATAFAVALKSWKLRSYGKVPDVLKGEGLEMLRKATEDRYEHRLVSFPVLSTNAPSWNGRSPV